MKAIGWIGTVVAAALSWATFHSFGWALLAAFFGWLYVVWYLIVHVIFKG